jgi:hypothetical protein
MTDEALEGHHDCAMSRSETGALFGAVSAEKIVRLLPDLLQVLLGFALAHDCRMKIYPNLASGCTQALSAELISVDRMVRRLQSW